MTNHWKDIKNADVVLVMGANPAENHPCGFKWALEARDENNATLLTRIRYYHRLPDFAALLDARGGDLAAVLAELKSNAGTVEDPFEMLPSDGR